MKPVFKQRGETGRQMMSRTQIEEYESFIKKIPGILSSKMIVNNRGEIIELHILADTNRNPKQISRDIQSALMVKYHLPLDHKVISIAQIRDENSIVHKDFRLMLKNIQITIEDSSIEVRVALAKEDKLFEGIAAGLNTTFGRFRALAEATINAVILFLNCRYVFSIIDIVKTSISDKQICVVAISHVTHQGEHFLVGSSPVRHDENEAVVKAVLDALNRLISKYS